MRARTRLKVTAPATELLESIEKDLGSGGDGLDMNRSSPQPIAVGCRRFSL